MKLSINWIYFAQVFFCLVVTGCHIFSKDKPQDDAHSVIWNGIIFFKFNLTKDQACNDFKKQLSDFLNIEVANVMNKCTLDKGSFESQGDMAARDIAGSMCVKTGTSMVENSLRPIIQKKLKENNCD